MCNVCVERRVERLSAMQLPVVNHCIKRINIKINKRNLDESLQMLKIEEIIYHVRRLMRDGGRRLRISF